MAKPTTVGFGISAEDGERIQTKVELHTIIEGKETRIEKENEHLNTTFLEIRGIGSTAVGQVGALEYYNIVHGKEELYTRTKREGYFNG